MLFTRGTITHRSPSEIEVSFQKRGQVCITDAAYRAMGEPEAVQFDYTVRHGVVLIPCRKGDPHSHPVRHQNGSYVISAIGLCDAMGLDVRRGARRFPAIRQTGPGVVSPRSRRTARPTGRLNVLFMHDDNDDEDDD